MLFHFFLTIFFHTGVYINPHETDEFDKSIESSLVKQIVDSVISFSHAIANAKIKLLQRLLNIINCISATSFTIQTEHYFRSQSGANRFLIQALCKYVIHAVIKCDLLWIRFDVARIKHALLSAIEMDWDKTKMFEISRTDKYAEFAVGKTTQKVVHQSESN